MICSLWKRTPPASPLATPICILKFCSAGRYNFKLRVDERLSFDWQFNFCSAGRHNFKQRVDETNKSKLLRRYTLLCEKSNKVCIKSPCTVVWFSHTMYCFSDYQRLCKQLPKLIKLPNLWRPAEQKLSYKSKINLSSTLIFYQLLIWNCDSQQSRSWVVNQKSIFHQHQSFINSLGLNLWRPAEQNLSRCHKTQTSMIEQHQQKINVFHF